MSLATAGVRWLIYRAQKRSKLPTADAVQEFEGVNSHFGSLIAGRA
jgi:hypothetical protein